MKGWQLVEIDKPLVLVERDDPQPGPGKILIDVRAAGLCHSDVQLIHEPMAKFLLPVIPGHELAGVVTAVGEGVTAVAVGDRVAECPTATMECPGYHFDGGFATKHVTSADFVVRVPDAVGWTLGAMMTDAGMTSYHALVKRGGCEAGMKVGIIGIGGLGQIAAAVAVARGAEVHVAEPKRDVWDMARALGVKDVVEDAKAWENQNFNLVVDYAGFGTTTAAALQALRFDGTAVIVGLGKNEATISTGDMVGRQSKLLASRGGTKEDIAELYELVVAGALNPAVTEIGFDDIPAGLADLEAHRVTGRLVARF